MTKDEEKKLQLRAARNVLPDGHAIVPITPTPGMLEQAAHNLAAEYGAEETLRLKAFALDVYGEFINAGQVR